MKKNSLARRDQLPQTLWKYPSHPLFDSANRGGRSMHIHHSSAQCVKRASCICILREQIECSQCGTCYVYDTTHRWCTQYVCMCSVHTCTMHGTSQAWLRANLGSVPACSPVQWTHVRTLFRQHTGRLYTTACKQIRHGLCQEQQLYNDVTIKQR